MNHAPELILIGAVAAVGIFHTMVPDHWVPIALIARQRGWSKGETAWASFRAGVGHVLSTLAIALVVWLAGAAVAQRFGEVADAASSVALIAFGGWIAVSAWRELHGHGHRHGHGIAHHHDHDDGHEHGRDHLPGRDPHRRARDEGHEHDGRGDPVRDPLYAPLRGAAGELTRHRHMHRHGAGVPHLHIHDHVPETAHPIPAAVELDPPLHQHRHKTTGRAALLIILGSSPMVEGIPAFFAAGKYGTALIAVMSVVFALATIVTYMVLCVYSTAGLQHMRLGAFERHGEVASGAFIALVGLAFWVWPVL